MDAPSMVHRSGDSLIIRSVVSGDQLFIDENSNINNNNDKDFRNPNDDNEDDKKNISKQREIENSNYDDDENLRKSTEKDEGLPQCKIKRNYSCSNCTFFTQNPRHYLIHLRDKHGEKIVINECKLCLYASRHYQKLVRHMKMVHGSTEGLDESAGRKRSTNMNKTITKKRKTNNPNELSFDMSSTQQGVPLLNHHLAPYSQLVQINQNNIDLKTSIQQQLLTKLPSQITNQNYVINNNNNSKNNNNNINISNNNNSSNNNTTRDDKKFIKCAVCDFTTIDRLQLIDHEKNDHIRTKFFRCIKCNYVTHIKARYSKHVKYHSMPMIKCMMCDFRTPYKWNLDRHMKNHGGAGPFKCSACNFTADIKQSLTVHEMNHHVPPVGHITNLVRRKNKVGGTDANEDIVAAEGNTERHGIWPYMPIFANNDDVTIRNDNNEASETNILQNINHPNMTTLFPTSLSIYNKNDTLEIPKPDIPTDQQNEPSARKPKRPIPNLIPINFNSLNTSGSCSTTNNNNSSTNAPTTSINSHNESVNNALNLSIKKEQASSSIYSVDDGNTLSINEQNFSKPNNFEEIEKVIQKSLKDFALFFGNQQNLHNLQNIQNYQSSESERNSPSSMTSQSSLINKKKSNISFYDKLKEKSVAGLTDPDKLLCRCGHISKCLSESIIHKKSCEGRLDNSDGAMNVNVPTIISSTRCQYCRHRCKSSADLMIHLQTCSEVQSNLDSVESCSETTGGNNKNTFHDEEGDDEEEDDDDSMDEALIDNPNEPHPMENVVFVWNKRPQNDGKSSNMDLSLDDSDKDLKETDKDDKSDLTDIDEANLKESHNESNKHYFAIETAPGYGEVTKEIKSSEQVTNFSLKRVFKCPQCAFWASTASRFHVHIVGHLNQKPFECSLCSYRSNWRWDITKHIRLKTIRDPNHENAKVLMNDETGRRNYTKYNKYITLMKVTAENNDTKYLKSGDISILNQDEPICVDSENSGGKNNNLMYTISGNLSSPPSTSSSPLSTSQNNVSNINSSTENIIINNNSSNNSMNNNLTISNTSSHDETSGNDMHEINNSILTNALSQTGTSPSDTNKNEDVNDKKKTTNFKCKKCNFRHSVRDVVLAHVKQHYRDAGILIDENNTSDNISLSQTSSASTTPEMLSNRNTPNFSQNSLLIQHKLLMSKIENTINQSAIPVEGQTKIPVQEDDKLPQPRIQSPLQQQTTHQTPLSLPPPPPTHLIHRLTQPQQPPKFIPQQINQVIPTVTPTITNDHGEVEEASCGVTSVSGWRCPAPYRCGHCHQVSNWKHVIQRHCRLKHRGDIKIELFDKISLKQNKNALPNYQPLNMFNQNSIRFNNINNFTNSNNTIHNNNNNNDISNNKSNQNTNNNLNNINKTNHIITPNTNVNSIQGSSKSDQRSDRIESVNLNITQKIISIEEKDQIKPIERETSESKDTEVEEDNNDDVDDDDKEEENFDCEESVDIDIISAVREKNFNFGKKYKCEQCPYITDSKYQFMYHETFHKTRSKSIYRCSYCSYNVSKRHLLTQHIRIHENNDSIENNSNSNNENIKEISYCQKCPARFLNEKDLVIHQKMHLKNFTHHCLLCTYKAKTDYNLKQHLNVHKQIYYDKTKEIEKNFKMNLNYPKPKIICVNTSNNSNEIYWIVLTTSLFTNLNNENNFINYDLDDAITSNKVPIIQQSKNNNNNDSSNMNINSDITLNNNSDTNRLGLGTSNSIINMMTQLNKLENLEKCPHCPYSTNKTEIIKNHLQFHKVISGIERSFKCQHCDFSINDSKLFTDHNKLHFTSIHNALNLNGNTNYSNNISTSNNVAFYTSFNDLEINLIKYVENNNLKNNNSNPVSTTQLVYKENSNMKYDEFYNGNIKNINNNNNHSNNDEKIILNINASDIRG